MAGWQHIVLAGQGRLGGIGLGDQQSTPLVAGRQYRREHPFQRPQRTIQGKLPHTFILCEAFRRNLPGSGKNAQGNGKVEAAAFLGQVRGSQIDGDSAGRKLKACVHQSTANTLPAFTNPRFGKSDDGQRRQAA